MSFQPSVRPGSIRPYGLIGERWQERGGDHGVFRHAITEEYDVPGFRGRRQSFANGQIAWSPDQGHRMLVSVHYDGQKVIFEWGPTDPFSYDFFIVRWNVVDGMPSSRTVHQRDVTGRPRTSGWFHVPMPPSTSGGVGVTSSDGRRAGWTFIVEGAHRGGLFGRTRTPQGWTLPLAVRL